MILKQIPSVFSSLASTSSSNEKKKILSENKSIEIAYIFRQTYDIFITFGIVKIDTTLLKYDSSAEMTAEKWSILQDILNKLSSRAITGNAARDMIFTFIDTLPKDWADIVLNILRKDLRLGVSIGIINKIYPNLLPEAICMGAMKYEKKRITFPAYADIKLDGIRCIATLGNDVTLVSRNGKAFKNYPIIADELKMLELESGLQLDGEITCGHFQNLMRTISRKEDGIDLAKDAIYNIFDIQCEFLSFDKRLELLQKLQKKISEKNLKHVSIVEGVVVNTENELQNFYQTQLKRGYEGVIVKKLDGLYEYRRSYNWMKVKPEETIDLRIIDVEEGTGKYRNMLGAFICLLPYIGEVRVGSGILDSERKDFWKRQQEIFGQIIEIKYQEKTKDGNLRFPVFIRFRPDK